MCCIRSAPGRWYWRFHLSIYYTQYQDTSFPFIYFSQNYVQHDQTSLTSLNSFVGCNFLVVHHSRWSACPPPCGPFAEYWCTTGSTSCSCGSICSNWSQNLCKNRTTKSWTPPDRNFSINFCSASVTCSLSFRLLNDMICNIFCVGTRDLSVLAVGLIKLWSV